MEEVTDVFATVQSYGIRPRPCGLSPRLALVAWLFLAVTTFAMACGSVPADSRPGPAKTAVAPAAGGFLADPNSLSSGDQNPAPSVDEQGPAIPAKSPGCAKLERVLYDVAVAPDPAREAAARGVYYQAGSVRVVIDLARTDAEMSTQYQATVERRVGSQVRALVPLSNLCALSEQAVVTFIHLPATASGAPPGN